MSKHTPGPWTVSENKRERTIQIDTERGTVVQPGAISWTPDARLIAAAPDLLEALQEIAKGEGAFSRDPLTHATNTIENMVTIARAAIAKATEPAP